MKKTLTAILAAAMLTMPMKANAGVSVYGWEVNSIDLCNGHSIQVIKGIKESERDGNLKDGSVEYSEVEYLGGTLMIIRSVVDHNDNGIFDGEDYFIDKEYCNKEDEVKGTNKAEGQRILNKLKAYFLYV